MFYLDSSKQFDMRYELGRFMQFDKRCMDVLNSYFLRELQNVPAIGNYEVTVEEGRPDLLSYKLFGTTQYWWILLYYNGLLEPADLKIGALIRYPSVSKLESIYFTLTSRGNVLQ